VLLIYFIINDVVLSVLFSFIDRRRQQQQQVLHYSVVGVGQKERVQRLESLGSCWVPRSKFLTAMPLWSWQS